MDAEAPAGGVAAAGLAAAEIKTVSDSLRLLAAMVGDLKSEIATEWDQLRQATPGADHRKLGKMVKGDIDALIRLIIQQEALLNEHVKARYGAAGQPALDLDAARSEIGRRLDRLRRARGTGAVSGRAE
ncbi:MAG: hypothetical protein HKP40_06150 [Litoreibacter sp.]|nr:hypothetical protein [Litoreibacter sp.]